MQVSLSLWSVSQSRIAEEVERYEPLVDSFHVDVMDGTFADNLLFGPPAVETLRALTRRPIVVHLMVVEPIRWLSRFVAAGADVLVIHPTACKDFGSTIQAIRDAGVQAGAALGLDEHSRPILDVLPMLSVVLVMATPIGVKGQQFDERALGTVRTVTAAREPTTSYPDVFVDGGIRWSSIPKIAAAGTDGVVAGSVVTSAPDPAAVIKTIAAEG